jgi:hypothetical protein
MRCLGLWLCGVGPHTTSTRPWLHAFSSCFYQNGISVCSQHCSLPISRMLCSSRCISFGPGPQAEGKAGDCLGPTRKAGRNGLHHSPLGTPYRPKAQRLANVYVSDRRADVLRRRLVFTQRRVCGDVVLRHWRSSMMPAHNSLGLALDTDIPPAQLSAGKRGGGGCKSAEG